MIKVFKEKITPRMIFGVISWVLCAVSLFIIALNVIRWDIAKNGDGYRLITEGNTVVGINVTTDADIHVVIPEGIKIIGRSAFKEVSNLKTVSLPETLIYIESGAFNTCTALESISFPDSLEYIGEGAFYQCTALSKVELGAGHWQEYYFNSDKVYYDGCGADDKEIADWVKGPHKWGLEKIYPLPEE